MMRSIVQVNVTSNDEINQQVNVTSNDEINQQVNVTSNDEINQTLVLLIFQNGQNNSVFLNHWKEMFLLTWYVKI